MSAQTTARRGGARLRNIKASKETDDKELSGLSLGREEGKKSPKTDSSKDGDSCTFNKNLREALLLADHALVRRVIRQVALVDSERPLVAHAFKHIPGRGRRGGGR